LRFQAVIASAGYAIIGFDYMDSFSPLPLRQRAAFAAALPALPLLALICRFTGFRCRHAPRRVVCFAQRLFSRGARAPAFCRCLIIHFRSPCAKKTKRYAAARKRDTHAALRDAADAAYLIFFACFSPCQDSRRFRLHFSDRLFAFFFAEYQLCRRYFRV
jgi:hypothetical protein